MANIMDTITGPLKAASDAAEKILQLKGVLEYGDEIRNLHQNVVAGLAAARIAQVELTAKQEEIDRLKREVAELKTRNAQLDRYELKRLPPGVFVYALKEGVQPAEPTHYACEKCFGDGKVRRLQSGGVHNGLERLKCLDCGAEIRTGTFIPPKVINTSRYNPFDQR